jgi:hypothetical protein
LVSAARRADFGGGGVDDEVGGEALLSTVV